jgi:hypothetical protein
MSSDKNRQIEKEWFERTPVFLVEDEAYARMLRQLKAGGPGAVAYSYMTTCPHAHRTGCPNEHIVMECTCPRFKNILHKDGYIVRIFEDQAPKLVLTTTMVDNINKQAEEECDEAWAEAQAEQWAEYQEDMRRGK